MEKKNLGNLGVFFLETGNQEALGVFFCLFFGGTTVTSRAASEIEWAWPPGGRGPPKGCYDSLDVSISRKDGDPHERGRITTGQAFCKHHTWTRGEGLSEGPGGV